MKNKYDYNYIVVRCVIGIIVFIVISLLMSFFTNTSANDVYTVAFSMTGSVIGGLVGGLLTLAGVRQTINSQKEQEALKLIPLKLVNLHKLDMKFKGFNERFKKEIYNVLRDMSEEFDQTEEKDTSTTWKIAMKYRDRLRGYVKGLEEEEHGLIEYASQIDIEVYKKLKLVFEYIDNQFGEVYSEIDHPARRIEGKINYKFKEEYQTEVEIIIEKFERNINIECRDFKKYLKEDRIKYYGDKELL
ncbi:hypothetical protein [Bacillus mobilis]|uniref:hypothetical protein n=1 Tax=Bacillus mobilis TaxID=2026190 RepID=UPI0036BA6CCD